MMETAALVVPITALEFIREEYLLKGEGPILTVYSLQSQPKACASLSVLHNYRIHGIRPKPQPADRWSSHLGEDLVVFGGKAVCLLRLSDEGQRLEQLSPLVELQDWALDVHWLSGNDGPLLGVALAHNSALLLDPAEGCVLALSSCQEGCLLYSALLLGGTWEISVLVGGTVFNQLVLWRPGGTQPNKKAPVERRLPGHCGVIFSLCYLQETGWLASASDDRSVRVWRVGDLGGAREPCGDPRPTCLRVLYGHQARVFIVKLSPGRVYSGGEDGGCLLWDWGGGGRVARTLKGHRAGGVRALAVSEGGEGRSRWVATGGADGGVRLWQVEGEEEEDEAKGGAWEGESLVNLGFKGRGVPKVVRVVGDGHWSQGLVVVNTDHGEVCLYQGGRWSPLWDGGPEFQSYCVMEVLRVKGWGSTAAREGLCAVGSLSGEVRVFLLSQPDTGVSLRGGLGKVHSLLWVGGLTDREGRKGYLLASGAEGLVRRWLLEVEMRDTGLVLRAHPLDPLLLPPCAKRWLTAVVYLKRPQGALWVCGDRRGSLLLFEEKHRADGEEPSREEDGKETSYRTVESSDDKEDMTVENGGADKRGEESCRVGPALQPVSCLFGLHGKQGVTWLCDHRGLLYSAGRDGCVRVLQVGRQGLEVLRVQRACKGMEWLERVIILEPRDSQEDQKSPELERTGSGKEARFVMLGFHSVHFVVWDPVRQERLLSVSCGGGHRSWSYCPHQDGLSVGQGALVFIKQGVVLASQPSGEAPSRAGSLDLREGLHGRGVGCVCHLGVVGEAGDGHWDALVTGGEDTSLTVLAVQSQTGTVKALSVISDHISNIRTLTAVQRFDGRTGRGEQTAGQPLSALVVSAGGRAQMQCYRLLIRGNGQLGQPSCQVIQVASHRLDGQWERKRNRHKTVKMDPETRYMSIAVIDDRTESVLLALACSDGAVRLFSVSELRGTFELLWESFHHQRCVLSVATCCLEDEQGIRRVFLFSTATDGRIAVWDMSPVANPEDKAPTETQGLPEPLLTIPAHQSGVNALAVWVEGPGVGHRNGTRITLASGGDDGQLSVAVIGVQYQEEAIDGSGVRLQILSQWSVASAHAAPLTALGMLSPGLLVSTSPDQRVCLWRLTNTGLSQRGVLFSHVADAAGLAVWKGSGDRAWAVVCGQGLQLLKVTDMEDGGNREEVTEEM
ncbi:WD repeat-containing protein 6 [Esox lucius]|uniref:tRNA (34-2'-O)-methyltransferase regulator WDR6 n=1 Tax=Esox lucius TaxID=8010 RepID=A0A3P8ZYR4_ESOLU|nr:WD repeat-containing protein 6 [Esox lucius]